MSRPELAAMLRDLLHEETGLECQQVHDDTHLRDDLKLDSVDMVSLLLQIETRLKINIESHELTEIARVGDLLGLLEKKLGAGAPSRAA